MVCFQWLEEGPVGVDSEMGGAAMEPAELTEKRKDQVLKAAKACMCLLRERFGVRRLVLFDSLAGQGIWPTQSEPS
jgi:hypothetical protein